MRPPTTATAPRCASYLGLVGMLLAATWLSAGCGDGEIDDPVGSSGASIFDHQDAVQSFSADVFVISGGSLVNPNADTSPDEPLYNVAGAGLGRTWGQWSAASAGSRTRCRSDGTTEVRLALTGLVPGGLYSVFYGTFGPDSENPLCPGVERTLPVDMRLSGRCKHNSSDPACAPSADVTADASGSASFRGLVEGCLLDATQAYFSIVYHFDGKSYGELPNRGELVTQGPDCRSSFGDDAMRQMSILQKW